MPSFSPNEYGFQKPYPLFESLPAFEVMKNNQIPPVAFIKNSSRQTIVEGADSEITTPFVKFLKKSKIPTDPEKTSAIMQAIWQAIIPERLDDRSQTLYELKNITSTSQNVPRLRVNSVLYSLYTGINGQRPKGQDWFSSIAGWPDSQDELVQRFRSGLEKRLQEMALEEDHDENQEMLDKYMARLLNSWTKLTKKNEEK